MNTVRIVERNTVSGLRWRLHWDATTRQNVATAVDALAAVRARDAQLVEAGAGMAMTVIEWEPRSRAGKAVVSMLARQS